MRSRFYITYLALVWVFLPSPAHTGGFPQAPDVVFYSASADGLVLGDDLTIVGPSQVAILDRYAQTYSTFHGDGYTSCGSADTGYFGGVPFLGSPDSAIDIDALFVHSWGYPVFSTTREFDTVQLGTVKDGSVVEYNPFVSLGSPEAVRVLVDEDQIFPDIELDSEQDVIFFSVTSTAGVVLNDDTTTVTKSEVAVAYATDVPSLGDTPYLKVPDVVEPMYPNGFAICGQQAIARFGGDEFFQALGEDEPVNIDAIYVFPNGHIAFSAAADFHSTLLGLIKDGSVVKFNPFVRFEDTKSLEYLVREDDLFLDSGDGTANNQDIDAFTIHEGKYYFSVAGDALLNGIEGEAIAFGDTDVVEYVPGAGTASMFVSGGDIFPALPEQPDEIDIDGLSFDRRGRLIFTTRESPIMKNGFLLADGALGAYHPGTTDVDVYALQSGLFGNGQAAEADISSVHIEVGKNFLDCSTKSVNKGLVNNNQDIDAFAVASNGDYYFSISKSEAVLNGHSDAPLVIHDGDIIAYNVGTNVARVAYAESDLFDLPNGSQRADIDALSFDRDGNPVFSVSEAAVVRGALANLEVDDSSLVVVDATTLDPVVLAVEAGELFTQSASDAANLNAVHITPALDPSCNPL